MPIRVVLAEDNLLVREGLRQLLATVEDIEVVAVCEGRDDLLETIERERPDAVLTDIRMPPGHSTEGIEVAHQLRRSRPAIGVVALSQRDASQLHHVTVDGLAEWITWWDAQEASA